MKAVMAFKGEVFTAEAEDPGCEPNFVLVETLYSAISPGTEMLLTGIMDGQTRSLGYSAMGIVRETGTGVTHVKAGDYVACYGAPYVHHAELLAVPKHLAVPLRNKQLGREAAFVGLGAIAIHALRQADLRFGESVAVVGLGVLGQLIGQIAHASSFRVFGLDLLAERCAKLSDADIADVCDSEFNLAAAIDAKTVGTGVDAVILSVGGARPGLVDNALRFIRDRGKIVIVGDEKTDFDRELMFRKEAQVLISRAGGPGRYDPGYERAGIDYPIGYVRWTEGRNMAEFIRLLEEKRISVSPLISHEIPLVQVKQAFDLYRNAPREVLGMLIDYSRHVE